MPRRTISTSQPYLSPTRLAAVERASPVALAQFWRQVREHNLPYWRTNSVVWVLDLADGELRDAPIGALLALQTPPFRVSYRVVTDTQLASHNCIYCPLINFSEDRGNPPYKFHYHLAPSQKAILPAMQSCVLPPLWLSCSQAAEAWPHPPPRPSCSFPAGTTSAATTPATPTPLGLTTGKATDQAIGCYQKAT
jgi:hypothetical protein